MKIKSILQFILSSLLLSVFIFSGCGKDEKSSHKSEKSTSKSIKEEVVTPLEPKTAPSPPDAAQLKGKGDSTPSTQRKQPSTVLKKEGEKLQGQAKRTSDRLIRETSQKAKVFVLEADKYTQELKEKATETGEGILEESLSSRESTAALNQEKNQEKRPSGTYTSASEHKKEPPKTVEEIRKRAKELPESEGGYFRY